MADLLCALLASDRTSQMREPGDDDGWRSPWPELIRGHAGEPLPYRKWVPRDAAIAVEQNVGQAVTVSLERPRTGARFIEVLGQLLFHRSIVAEGERREQYGGWWSCTARITRLFNSL